MLEDRCFQAFSTYFLSKKMEGNALSSTENFFQSNLLLLENARKQRIQTIFPSDTAFLTPGKQFLWS